MSVPVVGFLLLLMVDRFVFTLVEHIFIHILNVFICDETIETFTGLVCQTNYCPSIELNICLSCYVCLLVHHHSQF